MDAYTYEKLVIDWINYVKRLPIYFKVQDMLYGDMRGICEFIGEVLKIDPSDDDVFNAVTMGLINDGYNYYGSAFILELLRFSCGNEALRDCVAQFKEWRGLDK